MAIATGEQILASDVLTLVNETHGQGAKHRWTLNKLRIGAGSGAEPTEIDKTHLIPSGLIAMWHGLISAIPSGWVICDGNSSTPNLLARFVQGVATAGTNPGATGGATPKTTGGHQHLAPVPRISGGIDAYTCDPNSPPYGYDSGVSANYRKADSITSSSCSTWAKTQSVTDDIADIRPKYYDIAYIMKT